MNQSYFAQFRDYVTTNLMLDTGVRSSELFQIKMEHIDFKMKVIHLHGDTTKSRKHRILPLSNGVARLVMELINENKANWLHVDFLFCTHEGYQYNGDAFAKRFKRYREQSGVSRAITPHGLRHQFAYTYIKNGGDLFTLQLILGHNEIETTRQYIQMQDEDIILQHSKYSPQIEHRRTNRKGNRIN